MKNIDFNNIASNMDTQAKKTTMFDITKNSYKKFLSKIEASDLKNGYTRYLTERSFLEQMLEYAKEENRTADIKTIEARIAEILKILKEQKGIILK